MVKLSELQDADEIHEQDMLDPEYRREIERTQAESDAEIAELLRQLHGEGCVGVTPVSPQ